MQVYDKASGQFVEDPNFKPTGAPPTAPPSGPPTNSPTTPPPGASDTGSPPTISGPQMQFQQAWNNAPDLKTKTAISTTWKDANGYDLFGQPTAATSGKLTAAQQLRHDNIQSALASLDSTEVNLQQGGGAKGIFAGAGATIPIIGKYLDPAGAAYHDTMIEPATSLAKAITNSSRAPESVVNKYMSSLPQINDTPEFAHAKMNKMRVELLKQAETFKYDDITSSYDPKTGQPINTLQKAGVLPTPTQAPTSRFKIEAIQ